MVMLQYYASHYTPSTNTAGYVDKYVPSAFFCLILHQWRLCRSCDVTSNNLLLRRILHEQEVRDWERWVGEIEGCKQHGRVWAQLKETLVGT